MNKQAGRFNPYVIIAFIAALFIGWFAIWLIDRDSSQSGTDVSQSSTESQNIDLSESQTYWNDELVTNLEAYDKSNPNVAYSFSEKTIALEGNGLPDHETGEFPNQSNPNTISEQDFEFEVPRKPVSANKVTDMRIFGITLGGIPFEPATAETDPATGWNIEAFNVSLLFGAGVDDSNAHVQPNGTYHYHGIPEAVSDGSDDSHSNLIGFAADGFPVYSLYGYSDPEDSSSEIKKMQTSWQLKSGQRGAGEPSGSYNGDYTQDYEYKEGSGDLDRCGGILTVTPEFPDGTYAYYLTENFPYVPRCVTGEPSDSFAKTGDRPDGPPTEQRPPGPPPR